tara:strand:+ start:1605 stop:1799 length:195 start_codon:yes stop_codon:yes gene_type:complete
MFDSGAQKLIEAVEKAAVAIAVLCTNFLLFIYCFFKYFSIFCKEKLDLKGMESLSGLIYFLYSG